MLVWTKAAFRTRRSRDRPIDHMSYNLFDYDAILLWTYYRKISASKVYPELRKYR